ncbi:MAG: hypothetical protein WCO33_04600 [bacterium]
MDISQDLKDGLITIGRLVFVVVTTIFIVNTIILLLNRESKKDYTDQSGILNFKRYALGTVIMLIILMVIGYALFVGLKI